jgi:hypothetical protein
MELAANLTEHAMASKHGRATRKISRRGMWLPIGATRPPSPLIDPVREKYTNEDKLVEDLKTALVGSDLADVIFVVGILITFCLGSYIYQVKIAHYCMELKAY